MNQTNFKKLNQKERIPIQVLSFFENKSCTPSLYHHSLSSQPITTMPTCYEEKAQFNSFATSLAVHFPDYNLIQEEGHWNCYFQNKNEPSKGFYLNPNRPTTGKFTVTPRIVKTPHFSIGNVYDVDDKRIESPSAGFSMDRPADQIAKGIKTRFIPDFEIYYSNWIRQWESNYNSAKARESTVEEIANSLELEDGLRYSNGEVRPELNTYSSRNESLKKNVSKVYVSSANSIEITTSYLSNENAKKLIEFIKTLSK